MFANKVVLITGASSGIGAGTAEFFAQSGAKLILSGRNLENLNKTAERCSQVAPPNASCPLIVQADVTKESDIERIIGVAVKSFGHLDVLVNNAGVLIARDTESTSLEDFDTVMDTNLRSVVALTKLAIPHLIKSGGCIVNVSSVAGLRSFPNAMAYCVSKAALDQFTRCLALELAPKGVRVNSVNPGVVVTDLHRRAGMDEKMYGVYLEHSKSTHAMGRVGQVDEVAKAIGFLASNTMSSFMTGVCMPVDGGKHNMCPR